jgi:hypothetical protein
MIATSQAMPQETSASERRIATRRQPAVGTICRMDMGHDKKMMGLVWNLSTTGVSMLLHDPIQPGTMIPCELTVGQDRPSLRVNIRAIHLNKIRTGDYFLGAHFERPLAVEEMRPFLGEP